MQKYDKIWVPSLFEESNATVHWGGRFVADCAITKENVIVLTVEELREVWEAARELQLEVCNNPGPGKLNSPSLKTYLQSKGINIEG